MTAPAKPSGGSAPAKPAGGEGGGSGGQGDQPPKGGGQGGDEGQPPPAPPAPPTVPEKYQLKLEEDTGLDDSFVEQFSTQAKELKMSQEQAEKAFGFFGKQFKERMASLQASEQKGGDAYDARVKEWNREASADKEIGGVHFQTNVKLAQRAAATFFEPEVIDWLENTGFGSHPGVIRALVKIGKAIGEDKLVVPGGGSSEPKQKSAAEIMYPAHYKKEGQ